MKTIIEETSLYGVFLLKPWVHEDLRGNFYETYNEREYKTAGLTANFVQDDVSVSRRGVLKGIHGDAGTYKLIQCVYGCVFAVVVNCNESSNNFGKWQSFELSDKNKYQIYIPPMYGNGYYVQSDIAVYTYKQSTYYGEYRQFTYKWDDKRFDIKWPIDKLILSERDSKSYVQK